MAGRRLRGTNERTDPPVPSTVAFRFPGCAAPLCDAPPMRPEVVADSVQGEPAVYVSAFIVLVLFGYARSVAESLSTIAHEGGHMVMGVLTGHEVKHFYLEEGPGGGGATQLASGSNGVGHILVGLAGYLTPPLLGLAGVALVLDGKAWSVLVASAMLLFAAFLKARDLFTVVVVLLAAAGVAAAAFLGSPETQAQVAVGLVWVMLIGGVTDLQGQGLGTEGSDADQLAKATYIPAVVWVALFAFVAIICLWLGVRRLVGI